MIMDNAAQKKELSEQLNALLANVPNEETRIDLVVELQELQDAALNDGEIDGKRVVVKFLDVTPEDEIVFANVNRTVVVKALRRRRGFGQRLRPNDVVINVSPKPSQEELDDFGNDFAAFLNEVDRPCVLTFERPIGAEHKPSTKTDA